MAVVEKPSRRQILEDQAVKLHADRDAAALRVAELKEREAELLVTGYRANPGRRPDSDGARSEVHRLIAERRKLEESTIPALDANIAAHAIVFEEVRAEEQAVIFEEARSAVREHDEHERRILADLKAAHSAFGASWEELQALNRERRELPSRYALTTQGAVNQLATESRPKAELPASLAAAFDMLTVQAETDVPVAVYSSWNTDVEPMSAQDHSALYGRIAWMRETGLTTQALPPAPGAGSLRSTATAGETLPPQEPGEEQVESVDASMNAVGRRLFRGKQDS